MKIKIEYFIFYISYFFFSLYSFFGIIDNFKVPLKYLTFISMALIIIEFLVQLKKYKYKEIIKLFILLILSLIFVYKTNNYLILKLVLIIISVKNVDLDAQIKYDIKLRVIFLGIMLILLNVGIATDVTALFGEKIRHSMGFTNPNVLGHHILILCMELLFIYRNSKKITTNIICILIMGISYYYSGSRTAVLLFILLIFCFFILRKNKDICEKKYIKSIIKYSPIWTTVLVFFVFYLYKSGNQLGIVINNLLSGRLLNIDYFSSNFPITLFGSDLTIISKSCDTAPIYMLYAFGIVGLFLYIFSFIKLFSILYKRRNYHLIIIMFIFVLYGISEKVWLCADCNLILACLSQNIFTLHKEEKYE